MKPPQSQRTHRIVRLLLTAVSAAAFSDLMAQDASSRPGDHVGRVSTAGRRISLGLRVRGLPFDVVGDGGLNRSTSSPEAVWWFTTSSSSPVVGGGLALEYVIGRNWTLGVEALLQRANYQMLTGIYEGTDLETTDYDDRALTTLTEVTDARHWDFPVMLRYHGLKKHGRLARMFVAGGCAWRHTTRVHTYNELTISDGTTTTNNEDAQLSKRNHLGAVAAIGFRFVDDVNIKVTPEVRYTRWLGSAFDNESTRSRRNQLEMGIGLTF